ncbi:7-carboxy-7-deazaguanine synthase, Cx14CxxC type [Thiothrix caldifontis]|uniref:7-carboxy-7-deazaguanine synthase n=1 Tax=Thiothrix caldifontis TaxID=525918 RepID=A0A1H4FUJ2_9GAMM|nr:7-carboxy-7-deazaguanine synthase [Thiothrix caldifontis]SEB00996.1 7-carboxy-7-deazaguanine synthase, Cx14CxxC type [Thiothrix caldifontis]
MTYSVKEIFYTLQGEGFHAGRPAIFCRFAGCNLWSGLEADRAQAVCNFCDTDFVGVDGVNGGKFRDAKALVAAIIQEWWIGVKQDMNRFIVFTGGEPLLQLDKALIDALHRENFEIAVETNGTKPAPAGIDWLCVSPKADSKIVLTAGNELKLVYPQPLAMPERFAGLDFQHFYLQAMDGAAQAQNTKAAIAYCMQHPQWKLSVQTHKLLGIP